MKRRNWDAKTKAKVVLDGLSGRSVSEICTEYGIGQTQYYRWRDQFLSGAHRAFDSEKDGSEVQRLKKKTARYQQIIGALTVELKKTEDEL
ncbi:MAG: transposase [bacterium]